ncbi:MAG: hypothetical protein D3923_01025 [Candidatus Electrothrix sp. AR3]|nr:hypothetical protein [Candidatus Electrothrix sp. AR3]
MIVQKHLPEKLAGKRFYQPTVRGFEAVIRDRLRKWREIFWRRKQEQRAEKKLK